MKKLFAVLLSLSMLFALAACTAAGAKDTSVSGNDQTLSASMPDTAPSDAPSDESSTEPAKTGAKSLVVYFSWSGNTERVAKSIQSQTGSDIFEIVPKTPYSTDYNTVVDDAKAEQRNNARPAIKEAIPNIADYDTVYVGFPNWWGDMPMILYTFFDTYDLSGKTVALFCTSGGSGLSNTVNEVKALEPNAAVTKGLHIGSGASADPDSAVKSWLDEIGTAN